LYLDFENGTPQVVEIVRQLMRHLQVPTSPENLLLWNFNDSPEDYGQRGCTWEELVRAAQPSLVVIDSLNAVFPNIERGTSEVDQAFNRLRPLMQEMGSTVIGVWHPRKPDATSPPDKLDQAMNVREWFHNARGPSRLINGTDVRIGVDTPSLQHCNAALVIRGFRRVFGEIPTLHVARVSDDDGEPQGYTQVEGQALLSSEDLAVLAALPPTFRYKAVEPLFSKDSRRTTEFLGRVQAANVVRKIRKGLYEKSGSVVASLPLAA